MSEMTKYLQEIIVDMILFDASFSPSPVIYVGLLSSLSSDGELYSEINGNGYARQVISFDAPTGGVSASSTTVTFPTPTADWGTVTHVGIFTAATGGNMLYYETLSFPITILEDSIVNITEGSLSVSITGDGSNTFKNDIINATLRFGSITSLKGQGNVGLYTSITSGGDSSTEASGSGYSSQTMDLTGEDSSDGIVSNAAAIEFPTATSDYASNITHIGLKNNGGSLTFYKSLSNSTPVLEGQKFRIGSGELTFTVK